MRKTVKWFDPKSFEELYALGYTDSTIAAKIGCSKSAVFKWRKTTGRAPNILKNPSGMTAVLKPHGNNNLININNALRDKLGWKSEDLLELTISANGVLRIEKAVQREIQKKVIIDPTEAQRLYDKGYSDSEMSLALGVSCWSVSNWRYVRNLPVNRAPK